MKKQPKLTKVLCSSYCIKDKKYVPNRIGTKKRIVNKITIN